MPDHPTEIAGRPEHIAGRNIIDIFHRPMQRHQMAAIIAHHAFRDAGCAGGIENIKRVSRQNRHAGRAMVGGAGFFFFTLPVKIAPGLQRGR